MKSRLNIILPSNKEGHQEMTKSTMYHVWSNRCSHVRHLDDLGDTYLRKTLCPAECLRIHVSEFMWILKFYWLLPFTNETFHVSKPSTLHPAYKTIGFGLGKEHSPSILWRSDREPLTFINNKQLIFCTSVLHYTQIIHQKSPKPISIFFLKSKRSSSKQLCYAVVYVVWK
jgi:hypothetical protein